MANHRRRQIAGPGLALAALALGWTSAHVAIARADDAPSKMCRPTADARKIIDGKDGRWATVTPEQYRFLQGVYAMNPNTPAGLPFGASAVLATIPGADGAMIFFIDGENACTPMPVPKELVDLLVKVGSGEVSHEGSGL